PALFDNGKHGRQQRERVKRMQAAPPNLGELVPDVRRIAVLRANAIGDFVLTLPALQALRDTYPESHITLLGLPWHEAFLRGRESPVDEVVALPPISGLTEEAHSKEPSPVQERCMARLREVGFDIALQWHGGGRY